MSTAGCFGLKNPAVIDLAYWKDVKKSAAVLGGATLLYVLFELSSFTLIEMIATLVMVFTLACTVWSFVAGYIGRDGIPLPSFVSEGIPEDPVRKFLVERAIPSLNECFAVVTKVATGADKVFNLKVAGGCFLAAKIGHFFSVLTFLYLVVVFYMVVPKVYEKYQEDIDKVLDQVLTKLKELMKMAEEKMAPILEKLHKSKATEKKSE